MVVGSPPMAGRPLIRCADTERSPLGDGVFPRVTRELRAEINRAAVGASWAYAARCRRLGQDFHADLMIRYFLVKGAVVIANGGNPSTVARSLD